MNRRIWIFLPLCMAGSVLALFFDFAQAAVLKDIRIGEHEDYMRIVFELDAPTQPEQIQPMASGRLKVVFAGTTAGLSRKITVERSQQIQDIQIWNLKSALSTLLVFNFNRFSYDTFPLNDPPRIVLDVYPLPGAPAPAVSIESGLRNKDERPVAESKELAPPVSTTAAEPSAAADKTPPLKAAETVAKPPLSESANANHTLTASTVLPSEIKLSDNAQTNAPPVTAAGVDSKTPPQSNSNRLQFGLVIALVLITIVILVLLLFMLLSRHKWVEDKSRLNTKEFLQNQDRHIASLNARIEEQFKRYEEV